MAINGVNNTQVYNKPQKKVAKAVVGTVATAALVAAGLALGAKNGKFTITEESSAVAKKILPHLDNAGKFINQKVADIAKKVVSSETYKKATTKLQESGVTDALKEGFKKGQGIADDVAEKVKAADIKGKTKKIADDVAEKVKAADIKGRFNVAKQSVKDFVGDLTDKVINPAKFDAAKAKAADIAEETFNGFVK